jgi:NitT/TauT family transport system substrate-binding protein
VSTWRVGFGQLAECMSAEKSLNYDWIQAADGLNLFIAGAVDAMLAMSYNEMYQLLQTGLVQSEECIWRFSENGYNIQEDGVYMIREQYLKNPERAKRFARASRRGWEWAAQNPEATFEIVMDYVRREKIATNPVLQKLMLDEILRLLVARDTGFREYRLRPEMVEEASNILYRNGMLRRPVKMEELLP